MISKKAFLALILCSICLSACVREAKDQSNVLSSIQCIDRNGLSETISNTQRLQAFRSHDFLAPQPYKKVLRVYGRNEQGQSPTKITTYHDNGQIWQYLEAMDGRAHGIYREWHSNGQLKIEAHVIEGMADLQENAILSWVFDGTNRVWDEYGHLIAEIPYDKGSLHTTSLYYFPNGTLQKVIPYKEGKIDGTLCEYDMSGNILEEICYEQGERNGPAIAYWNAKDICYVEEYDHGLLIQGVYFDASGNCCAEIVGGAGERVVFAEGKISLYTEYKAGKPEGTVRRLHADGSLHSCYQIIGGKKEGEEWEYYRVEKGAAAQPKLLLHWHEDKLQGVVKTWYPHGVQESQWEMQENKKQGYAFAWYRNGDLMLSEEYENGLLIEGTYYKRGEKSPASRIEEGKGRATLFSAEGLLLKKIDYEKGKPLIDKG